MKVVIAALALGIATACLTGRAIGQDAAPAQPDAAPARVLGPSGEDGEGGGPVLGEPFESLGLGIALRRPAGSKVIRHVGGDVEFIHEKKKWNLKVARMPLTQSMPLETSTDADGARRTGLLEVTVDRLKDTLPGAAVLRNDVVRVGDIDVGMIALRHVKGLETLLSQQALVRASDRMYYTLTLTSPGSKASGKEPGDDPAERQAVEAFGEVIDTVRLLDQRPLVRDQEDRIYATLALFVNLGGQGKIESRLIPQQWFRVLHNGKDIGYLYAIEETADGIPGDASGGAALRRKKPAGRRGGGAEGILIGTRSRTAAGEDARIDAESWMFCSSDRRLEQWSTLQVVQNLKDQSEFDHATTVGSSSRRVGRRLDRQANEQGLRFDKEDPNQPPVREIDDYVLDVTHSSKSEGTEPFTQGVADPYIPQALSHLLPRLLPVDQPKKYLFAVYVPEVRKVMYRYVDVGEEKRLTFQGESMRAVPISDRIGVEGSVTTHYMTIDGKYLGRENADTGVVVLPSDEATITGIWKDANLSRPADVKPGAKTAVPTAGKIEAGKALAPADTPPVNRRRQSGR